MIGLTGWISFCLPDSGSVPLRRHPDLRAVGGHYEVLSRTVGLNNDHKIVPIFGGLAAAWSFFFSSKLKRKTKRKKKIRAAFGLRFYSTRLIWSAFIHYLGNYARRMNLSSLWHGAILLNWTSTEENIHVSESAPQLPCFISRASRGVGSSASAKTSHPHKILPLYHIILVLLTRSGTESNFFSPLLILSQTPSLRWLCSL